MFGLGKKKKKKIGKLLALTGGDFLKALQFRPKTAILKKFRRKELKKIFRHSSS